MVQMIIVVILAVVVLKAFQHWGGDNSGEPWPHDWE